MFDILRKLNQYKIFDSEKKITIKNKKQPMVLKIFVFYNTIFAFGGRQDGDWQGPGPFKQIVFLVSSLTYL
jgi:hypothetical protein